LKIENHILRGCWCADFGRHGFCPAWYGTPWSIDTEGYFREILL